MGKYGITSKAQLIDHATIRQGCQAYIDALNFYVEGGQKIVEAGSLCNAQALSVDDASLGPRIEEVGQQAIAKRDSLAAAAEAVYAAAVNVYNEQVQELNEYNRRQAELAKQRAAARKNNKG